MESILSGLKLVGLRLGEMEQRVLSGEDAAAEYVRLVREVMDLEKHVCMHGVSDKKVKYESELTAGDYAMSLRKDLKKLKIEN